MLLGPVTPTSSSRFYIEYSFKEKIMAKQQGKMTLAQKQAAEAAANKAHIKSQQAGAEQPVETALTQAMRAAQQQTAVNETVTVTVTAETGNDSSITSQETLSPAPVAEPEVLVPEAAPSPVPELATPPVPSQAPAPAVAPVAEPTAAPVPVPVQSPTSSQQQQRSTQTAVYQPSEAFKKTHGFW